jgi:hypothetical protein
MRSNLSCIISNEVLAFYDDWVVANLKHLYRTKQLSVHDFPVMAWLHGNKMRILILTFLPPATSYVAC